MNEKKINLLISIILYLVIAPLIAWFGFKMLVNLQTTEHQFVEKAQKNPDLAVQIYKAEGPVISHIDNNGRYSESYVSFKNKGKWKTFKDGVAWSESIKGNTYVFHSKKLDENQISDEMLEKLRKEAEKIN